MATGHTNNVKIQHTNGKNATGQKPPNKIVHALTTPCRIVNEKLAERKRKKEEQRRNTQQRQPINHYNEPYPDYPIYDDEFGKRSLYTPVRQEWGNRRRSRSYQENGGRYVERA